MRGISGYCGKRRGRKEKVEYLSRIGYREVGYDAVLVLLSVPAVPLRSIYALRTILLCGSRGACMSNSILVTKMHSRL